MLDVTEETTDQLFIVRKRKKWKFAHFENWANCFSAEDIKPATLRNYFGRKQPLILEIGAGTADLSVCLATQIPTEDFIAVDVKADRLYTGAKYAQEHDIANIAFVRAHGNQLGDVLGKKSVKKLWITFPDPFPRQRQAKHRLTNQSFLRQYRNWLTKEGSLHFKTDNRELFLWSLEQLVTDNWCITELSFDLHASNLDAAYKTTTAYERRFMAEGIDINYVTAVPR